MKKLSLKSLKLEVNDILQREQLKTIFGGYEPEWCTTHPNDCSNSLDCYNPHCPNCVKVRPWDTFGTCQ